MERILEEKKTVGVMIALYCRKVHGEKELCADCQQLQDYAMMRLEQCKFGEQKPTCDSCKVHCYKPEMRERIRTVMRYSGPRMMLYHPVMAVRHIIRKARS